MATQTIVAATVTPELRVQTEECAASLHSELAGYARYAVRLFNTAAELEFRPDTTRYYPSESDDETIAMTQFNMRESNGPIPITFGVPYMTADVMRRQMQAYDISRSEHIRRSLSFGNFVVTNAVDKSQLQDGVKFLHLGKTIIIGGTWSQFGGGNLGYTISERFTNNI
jgi:hypothetical protein